jgi:GH15 family glucan-1,4-alpha-glucosidase
MVRDMAAIGDYALLADSHGAALVGRDGSIDWCCIPRFDRGAVFSRLLDPDGGACEIAVAGGGVDARRYVEGTLVLESTLRGEAGEARLLDCMPFDDPLDPGREHRAILRVVEGVRGTVTVRFRVPPALTTARSSPGCITTVAASIARSAVTTACCARATRASSPTATAG